MNIHDFFLIIVNLVNNLALLVALSVVSGFIGTKQRFPRMTVVLQGVLFGAVAVIGMQHPPELAKGLIFDGRSVAISLCGLFFGPLAALVASALALAERIREGGVGVYVGCAVILASAAIGIVFHYRWRPREREASVLEFWGFGLLVHVAMLLCILLLPGELRLGTLEKISLPVMIAYPLATILVGRILSDQMARFLFAKQLHESLEEFRTTLYSIGDAVIGTDCSGRVRHMNQVAEKLTGWSEAEALDRPIAEVFRVVGGAPRLPLEIPVQRILDGAATSGGAGDAWLQARNGQEFPIADSAAPIRDASGTLHGAVLIFRDVTQEREAALLLRESEERHRTILRTAMDGFWMVDSQGHILEVNETYGRMVGYSKEELLKMSIPDLEAIESAEAMAVQMGRIVEVGELRFESRHRHRDGHVFDVEVSAQYRPADQRVVAFIRDITGRKRAEDVLQKSQALLNATGRMARVGGWEYEVAGQRLTWTDEVYRIHEVAPEFQPTVEKALGFYTEESRPSIASAFRRTVEEGSPFDLELTLDTAKGRRLWVHAIGQPVYRDGRVAGVLGAFQDITERKRAEAALRESEARFNVFMDQLPAAVFIKDVDGRTLFVNPYLQRLLGWSDWQSKTTSELVAGEVSRQMVDDDRRALRDGPLTVVEVLTDVRGQQREFETIKFPIRLEGQAPLLCGISIDLTDRRRMELALRESEAAVRNKLKALLEPTGDLQTLGLADIIDADALQALMEDFYRITHIGSAIIDQSGKVLVAVGWQDVCTKFHRCHPETLANCIESDTVLSDGVEEGTFKAYHCKNHMWDMATPIMVGGRHVGNIYLGQFFYENEVPDVELFRQQARQYGFDEAEYLAALSRVPHWNRETLDSVMMFYARLAKMISTLSYSMIQLSRTLAERQQAEAALRESEERLRLLGDNLPDSYVYQYLQRPDGSPQFLYLSGGVESIHGVKVEAILSDASVLFRQLAPEQRQTRAEAEAESLRSLSDFIMEMQIRRPDGQVRWLQIRSRPRRNPDGMVVWNGVAADISGRKLAEEELRESEQRFRTLADSGQALIWTAGLDKKCDYFNQPWLEFTGRSLEQEQGDGWVAGVHPEDLERCVKIYTESFDRHERFSMDYRLRSRDGSYRWIQDNGSPRYDTHGRFIGYIGHCLDINDRKRVEAELQEHREHLEELVQQRTSELAVARDQAQAANRSKSVFLANMSHELRTPLTAILGFADVMSRDPALSGRTRESLSIILRSGEHLLVLINNILDLSKIEAGRMKVESRDVDLDELFRDITGMMHGRAEAKGLRLSLERDGSFPRLARLDAGKLRQILVNLVGNAIKFTQEGRVTIRLASELLPGGYRLRIEVQDTGIGLSAEDLQRIYKPFEQVGMGSAEGTGLGLAISRQYAGLLGGEISVESEPGRGSCFRLVLPAGRASLPPPEPAALPPASLAGPMVGLRLLVADDQADARLLIRRFLEPYGFELREAVNGREAVAICQEWHPDLVFLDRRMPELDGLAAVRQIRQMTGGDKPVIIAVSAHTFKEEQQEMLSAGCNGFLAKPFSHANLLEQLRLHLGGVRGGSFMPF